MKRIFNGFTPPNGEMVLPRSSPEVRQYSSDELTYASVTDIEVSSILAELDVPRSKKLMDALKVAEKMNRGLIPRFLYNPSLVFEFAESIEQYLNGLSNKERENLKTQIEQNIKYRIHYSTKWRLVFARYLLPNVDYTFKISSITGIKDSHLASLATTLATQTVEKLATESKVGLSAGTSVVGKVDSHASFRTELSEQISRSLETVSTRQMEFSEQKEHHEEMSFKVTESSWYSVWQLVDTFQVERINQINLIDDKFNHIFEALQSKFIAHGESYSTVLVDSQ